MLTPKYAELSIQEQREFIGSLVHLCQTNERCFDNALMLLNWAQRNGHLDRVKLMPKGWDYVPKLPKTHKVLDMVFDTHYHEDKGHIHFDGTQEECEAFAISQSPYFMFKVVPMTDEEIENHPDNHPYKNTN